MGAGTGFLFDVFWIVFLRYSPFPLRLKMLFMATQTDVLRGRASCTWMKVQRLVVAEVCEAAAPLGDISGAVAEDLAIELRGRQAGLHRFLLPLNQHH